MNSLFDKLNLRPQERRLVVIVAGVVFLVLNFWLVWPHFGDLGRAEQRRRDAEKKLQTYMVEIKRGMEYTNELKRLSEQGQTIADASQSLELMKEVSSQAILSSVNVSRYDSTPRNTSGGRTNAFFEEASLVITVNTGEKELVDFLWNLASRNSLIRVRSMSLQPDVPQRMRLNGNITLVESFQKKAPPKLSAPAASPAKSPDPAAKPATAVPKPAPVAAKATNAPARAAPTAVKPAEPVRLKEAPKRTPPPPPPPQPTPPTKP